MKRGRVSGDMLRQSVGRMMEEDGRGIGKCYLRVRKARRSHEIMIPRFGGVGRNVNPSKADEVFAEHGYRGA